MARRRKTARRKPRAATKPKAKDNKGSAHGRTKTKPNDLKLLAIALYAVQGSAAEVTRKMQEEGHDVADRSVRRWIADAVSGKNVELHEALAGYGQELRAHTNDSAKRMALRAMEIGMERLEDRVYAIGFKTDPTPQLIRSIVDGAKVLTPIEKSDVNVTLSGEVNGAASPAAAAAVMSELFGKTTPDADAAEKPAAAETEQAE